MSSEPSPEAMHTAHQAYNMLAERDYEKRISELKDPLDRWRCRVAVERIRRDVKFLETKQP